MKRTLFVALVLSVLLYLLCFPGRAFQASADGLRLWFYTVLPSLLPFLILSDLLIHTGKIPRLLQRVSGFFRVCFGLSGYGAYAFLLGLFCGYPMGAKLTADLLRENRISRNEADYLLTFSNNASPMFVSTYILLNHLKDADRILPTFGILYLAVLMTSLIFRFRYRRFSCLKEIPAAAFADSEGTEKSFPASLGRLADVSIMSGFETITRLGGYILLFSIGASMITVLTQKMPLLSWTLPGLVEITTGIHQLAGSPFPYPIKYLLILTVTAFGGLSGIAQTKGMLSGTPLKITDYIIGKLVQAACTLLIGGLFLVVTIVL